MHYFRSFGVLLFTIFLLACGNSTQNKTATQQPIADTAKFYPIDQFIREQIQYVDLRNFIITKSNSISNLVNKNRLNITDTSQATHTNQLVISKEAFTIEAAAFLTEAIAFSKQKYLYKETVFQDLSTASYTINYTAINTATPIQRVDILLSEETNILKRLFIRKNILIKDTIITQQYSWIANESFQINSSAEAPHYNKTTAILVNFSKEAN